MHSKKECLKSFESLCVFGHRKYYNNLLCILVEFYNPIHSKATPIPKSMMKIFGLNTPRLVNHMMQQGKFEEQEFLHTYKVVINRSEFFVRPINICPV
jgi:hypothetical protein